MNYADFADNPDVVASRPFENDVILIDNETETRNSRYRFGLFSNATVAPDVT